MPQQSVEVKVDIAHLNPKPEKEYFINFEVGQKEAGLLIPAGHIVVMEQFDLGIYAAKEVYNETTHYPTL